MTRRRVLSRRRLLAGVGGMFAGAVAAREVLGARGEPPWGLFDERRPGSRAAATSDASHLAWVWQFDLDGDPAAIREGLAAHGLGVVVKTHDGPDWMGDLRPEGSPVTGPASVARLAAFFEQGSVPFHAWAVAQGIDPGREAEMAAGVLSAGARSIFLDLEGHEGFWEGTASAAERFGERLRQMQPGAWVSTSVDPRPWELERIPLATFASFSDEIAPQVYWGQFNSEDNVRRYRASGYMLQAGEVTVGVVLGLGARRLARFGLPLHPVGDGTVASAREWGRFLDQSYRAGAESVSMWRYGLASADVLGLLRHRAPGGAWYVVEPGDTLGGLAARWRTTVGAILAANRLADPDLLPAGRRLRIPGAGTASAGPSRVTGRVYTVKPGETLSDIAAAHGSTVEAIVQASGIADSDFVLAGRRVIVPVGIAW